MNVTHFHTTGNLFLSCNLKGNCTFATQAATIGNDVAEEDPGVEQEVEEEMEPSAGEEVEALGEVEDADQCWVHCSLYWSGWNNHKKNKNCFGCGGPNHLIWDCLNDISKSAQKVYLNTKERMAKREAKPLRIQLPLSGHLQMRFKHKDIMKVSLLELRLTHSFMWAWKHSLSWDQWWEMLGTPGQWFYSQCSDPRVCQRLVPGH